MTPSTSMPTRLPDYKKATDTMHKQLEEPPEGVISGSNDRDVPEPTISLTPTTRRQLWGVGVYV